MDVQMVTHYLLTCHSGNAFDFPLAVNHVVVSDSFPCKEEVENKATIILLSMKLGLPNHPQISTKK